MKPLGPFGPSPRLAIGVSGGPHSLALAMLVQRWARARGADVLALVADHGLRAKSAAEAAHVAALLSALGMPAKILPLRLPTGPALQERARASRLAALLAACRAEGRLWLLLGHHRLDQAETLLFRALRGSGDMGLAAMSPLRAASEALLLRPLLAVPPARLEATLEDRGVAPVRDPSNLDHRFARIRLRLALDDEGGVGAGVAALAEAAAAFSRRRVRLEAALAARLTACVKLYSEGFVEVTPEMLGEDAVADLLLGRLVRVVSGRVHAPARGEVTSLRRRGHGTLSGAWLQGGRRWRLLREPAGMAAPVIASLGTVWDNRFRLAGRGAAGHVIGAIGVPSSAVRAVAHHLPPAVVPTLPAIFCQGSLVAVPSLLYPSAEACAPFGVVFAPAGGPVTG